MSNVIVTMTAGAAISKGHAVKISGANVIHITNAASDDIFGVAINDAASGDKIGIATSGDCHVAVADDDFGVGAFGIFTNAADGDKWVSGVAHFRVLEANAAIPVGETGKAFVRINLFPTPYTIA